MPSPRAPPSMRPARRPPVTVITIVVLAFLAILGVYEGGRRSATAAETTRAVVSAAAAAAAAGNLVRAVPAGGTVHGSVASLDVPVLPGAAEARALMSPFVLAGTPVLVTRNVSLTGAAGIVVLLHGCTHDADVWRLAPLERRVVAELVARRLFAVALSASSNSKLTDPDAGLSGCWDTTTPAARNEDVRSAVAVALALLKRAAETTGTPPPLYAIGASSGGYFAHTLARVLALRAIVSVVAALPPDVASKALAAGGRGAYAAAARGVDGANERAEVPPRWRPASMPRTLLLVSPRDEAFSTWALRMLQQAAAHTGLALASGAAAAFDGAVVPRALEANEVAAARMEADAWSTVEASALINAVPILPRRLAPLTIAGAMPSVSHAASGALYWMLRNGGLLLGEAGRSAEPATAAGGVAAGEGRAGAAPAAAAAVLEVSVGRVEAAGAANGDTAGGSGGPLAQLTRGRPLLLARSSRDAAVTDAVDAWMVLLRAAGPVHPRVATGVPQLDVAFDVALGEGAEGSAAAGDGAAAVRIALAPAPVGAGWDGGRSHGTVAAAAAAVRAGVTELLNDLYVEHEMTAQGAAHVAEWLASNA